jgi:outer membrane lipoprotein-sorting protein
MNPKEKIEQLIKKFEVATTDKMDKWVCDDALEVIRKTKHAKSLKARPNILRNIVKSKIAKIATAAVIIIAVIAGIDYFGGSIDIATPTFADVIRPFLSARTATFTLTTEGPNDQLSFYMKGMFAEPGSLRYDIKGEFEAISVIDMEQGKFITLMPEEKTAMIIETANMSIEKQSEANPFFVIRRQLQQAQDTNNGDVEFLGECQINGASTDGYLLREVHGIEMTVWVDTGSLLPVRIEYDMSEMFGRQMKMVMSDFEFDVELDESLFSLEIPEGYTVETMQMDSSGPLEKDLIEMFSVWGDATGGKFPSALSLNVEVIKEFSTALTGDLFKQESQEFPENKEQLHQLLDEIKQDLTQLQGIIQDDKIKMDLQLLGDSIKKHLKELREYKEHQEEAKQRYIDELTSRAKNLASDPFKNVREIQEKMQPVTRGLVFVQALPADSDWHYAGKDVDYGDGNTPIFWYRPKGLGICRVIYGDLSIADVDFSEQPKEPEVSHDAITENRKDLGQSPAVDKFPKHPLIAEEEDFIEALGIWTDFTDGRFPASIGSVDIIMDFGNYQNERLSKDGRHPSNEQVLEMRQDMISVTNEICTYISKDVIFAYLLKANSDWHYAGKGIAVGDSDKAIFWYKPKGSNKYRVIYADLTVEETTAAQLPVDTGKTQSYKDLHKEKVERVVLPSEPAAVEILEKVQETYDALYSYRSVCEVVADYNAALIFDVNNFSDLRQHEVEQLEQ